MCQTCLSLTFISIAILCLTRANLLSNNNISIYIYLMNNFKHLWKWDMKWWNAHLLHFSTEWSKCAFTFPLFNHWKHMVFKFHFIWSNQEIRVYTLYSKSKCKFISFSHITSTGKMSNRSHIMIWTNHRAAWYDTTLNSEIYACGIWTLLLQGVHKKRIF